MYHHEGVDFEWDDDKALQNERKHGVPFETACEVFFDPFVTTVDATGERDESRQAAIGLTATMKIDDLKRRLRKDRPMTTVTMRMPEDVVGDLKRVAPARGFGGYQPLIRAYVGQGLRADLARLDASPDLDAFIAALERQGVEETTIEAALGELHLQRPAPAAR